MVEGANKCNALDLSVNRDNNGLGGPLWATASLTVTAVFSTFFISWFLT